MKLFGALVMAVGMLIGGAAIAEAMSHGELAQ
jgi:hypothetical protein